jgi:hypothetical protein
VLAKVALGKVRARAFGFNQAIVGGGLPVELNKVKLGAFDFCCSAHVFNFNIIDCAVVKILSPKPYRIVIELAY